MDIFLALASGAFIGSVLGFIGAGGSMLAVPILIYIFDFSPIVATTASLAVVCIAAVAGVIPKWRKGDVLVKEAVTVWALGLITNVGGGLLSKHIHENLILTGFALILIFTGFSMLRAPIMDRAEKKVPFLILVLISLTIGAITGVFGIGGGFLAIPILVLFFHTPQNKAAGTSLLIIAMNCATSLLAHHAIWHNVRWSIPLLIAATAVVISLATSHYGARVNAKTLRRTFAFTLFAIALFTLLETWIFPS
ncbi:unannotated protein [freshwater metagenome]|uniref:Unannotated protein n=1 Tax=freshwater metagenome TaxID=449393 RepID=A0A6J6SAW2_9ZZZZ|nr:TSUP family transporter [Actinomycetota bacterium]